MVAVLIKFKVVVFNSLVIWLLLVANSVQSTEINQGDITKALDSAKKSLEAKDYNQMWQEMDKITRWLEKQSPRSGLAWDQAEKMIRAWVKKNWRKDVLEIKAVNEGGMETTTQRHQGSFYGWVWDTGEKTVTKDFVFEAKLKAVNAKGKIFNHRVRFHFDKGHTGWFIQRAGVM